MKRKAILKLYRLVNVHGIAGCAKLVLSKAFNLLRKHSHKQHTAPSSPDDFDSIYGADTGGVFLPGPDDVVCCRNWVHGTRYEACNSRLVMSCFSILQITLTQFTFMDLGCDKGRALLLAAMAGFKKVIGVEHSMPLCEVAKSNLRILEQKCLIQKNTEVVCQDASEFKLPWDPLVLFMANPFGEKLMRKVKENVLRSLQKAPRRMIVLYIVPTCARVWMQTPGFRLLKKTQAVLILDNEWGCARYANERESS